MNVNTATVNIVLIIALRCPTYFSNIIAEKQVNESLPSMNDSLPKLIKYAVMGFNSTAPLPTIFKVNIQSVMVNTISVIAQHTAYVLLTCGLVFMIIPF